MLTASYQQSPKSVFKYSLAQQENILTSLRRALPQCYVAGFEYVRAYNL